MTAETTFDQAFAGICKMEGSLGVRLAALSDIMRAYARPFADAYDELVATLLSGEAVASVPNAGDSLPPFLLPDHQGRLVSSVDLAGSGPLVVSFNRGHWCEYCDLELRAFSAAHAEFSTRGARAVSIIPERQAYIRKVAERSGNSLLVLSDMDNSYAMELGLVIWLGDKVRTLLQESGLDLEQYQGNGMWFVPVPATFVIAQGGTILARYADPDFRRRMAIEDILAALPPGRQGASSWKIP